MTETYRGVSDLRTLAISACARSRCNRRVLLLPCRFSRPIEPWLTLIFPADSSSGFGYAAPEIPGFFERLIPLQCSSSILRTAEFWPELAVPVCSVPTFDYWTRTDANLELLALE